LIFFFFFATASRLDLGPTVYDQMSTGGGVSDRGVKLITHLNLAPKLRIQVTLPLLQNVFMAW
jgi:hypothetical protein